MKLKYLTKSIIAGALGICILSSCSDEYLDKKVDVSETQEKIYSDSAKVANVINDFYSSIGYSFAYNRFNRCGLDLPAKESEARAAEGRMGMYLAQNTVNASNAENDAWKNTYRKWRGINIFMNNYNDGTIGKILSSDPNKQGELLHKSSIEYWKGQAFFLRAWYVFTMIKHYGGIPLIDDKVYSEEEKINVPRSTYEESVKYAVDQCDSAFLYLERSGHIHNLGGVDPDGGIHARSDGRACGMTALALKARIYLYAASPLVNCQRADDPGLLVSYGSYSKERWQLAYDAAKKFMDMNNAQAGAETGIWYELRQGVIDNTTPTKSWWPKFYHAFMDDLVSSKESIFCDFMKNEASVGQNRIKLDGFFAPNSRGTRFSGLNQLTGFPTQELVDAFPMADGFPRGDSRSKYTYQDGDGMYDNRDPRLKATVSYNGAYRFMNGFKDTKMRTYTGDFVMNGNFDETSASKDGIYQPNATSTGYYRMKSVFDNGGLETYVFRPTILMRYAEILMIAAEAANELVPDGAPAPEESKEYIRAIRQRADIEEGETGKDRYGVLDNLTKEEMRELIYTERQIEFAFEEHRYWDVRRWKIAPQVLDGPSHGMEITRKAHDDGSETFTYRRIEVMNHVWDDRLYWWPIPLSEISKSDALEQNPGY